MKPIIALKNITKSYRNFAILHDVSLEIPEGSFTVLIGPSGCGKSTLLKMIAGIEHPSSGSVIAPEAMTMVFQNGSLLPWKTAHENIGIALESSALSTTQKNTAISHALTMMGLDALAGSYPRDLSGGQRQRVGIARALVSNPSVLLLDEPFSALDAETTETLHAELLSLWKEKNLTIFMVSHSLDEAIELADAIYVMQAGRIIAIENITLKRPRATTDPDDVALRKKLRGLL